MEVEQWQCFDTSHLYATVAMNYNLALLNAQPWPQFMVVHTCSSADALIILPKYVAQDNRLFDYTSKIYCTSADALIIYPKYIAPQHIFFIIHPKLLNKTTRALIIYTKYTAPQQIRYPNLFALQHMF